MHARIKASGRWLLCSKTGCELKKRCCIPGRVFFFFFFSLAPCLYFSFWKGDSPPQSPHGVLRLEFPETIAESSAAHFPWILHIRMQGTIVCWPKRNIARSLLKFEREYVNSYTNRPGAVQGKQKQLIFPRLPSAFSEYLYYYNFSQMLYGWIRLFASWRDLQLIIALFRRGTVLTWRSNLLPFNCHCF